MKKLLICIQIFLISVLVASNVYADSNDDFHLLEESIVLEYSNGFHTGYEYTSYIWEKYDDESGTYIYHDDFGEIIEKCGTEYRKEFFSPKYTIDGQLLHWETVKNYIDEYFTEVVTLLFTDSGEEAISFYEYGINGDLEIKYRTEKTPQPTYNLYVDDEIFYCGISGEKPTLPAGKKYNRVNEHGDVIVYETVKWVSSDLEHEYVPGKTFTIPNRDVYLYPIYASKTDIASHLILFDLNGGLGKVDEIYDYEWCKVKLPIYEYANKTDNTLIFSHWTDGTNNYNPGDTFIIPDHDVTLTAVWKKNASVDNDNPFFDWFPIIDQIYNNKSDSDKKDGTTSPSDTYTCPYTDISGHWAENIIQFIDKLGLIDGITETEFHPDEPMTREMFVTAMARLAGVESDYVNWAIDNGVLLGYGNGEYGLTDTVTREQMAVFFLRFFEKMGIDTAKLHVRDAYAFADDETISDWAADAVYEIQSIGLIQGKENNLFDPQGTSTRAEAATVLYNLIKTITELDS